MTVPYHQRLRSLIDGFVHEVYRVTKSFPKEEIYGVTSQLRRASLSIALNYIEGFARFRKNVNRNFLEISFGSFQETKYLLDFCFKEHYLSEEEYESLSKQSEEIGAMLWGTLKNLAK